MDKCLLITFVIIMTLGIAIATDEDDQHIVGGFETSIEKVPWQVSVQVFSFHICGGSIISAIWVLTGGQCASYKASAYSVRVGSSRHASGGSVVKVQRVERHSKFNGVDFDFALLKLNESLTFSDTVKLINLLGEEAILYDGEEMLISGWGTQHGSESNDVIHAAYVALANQKYCKNHYRSIGHSITDRMICVWYNGGGKDHCISDPGGALIAAVNHTGKYLLGTVSWGLGCSKPSYPGVFGRIPAVHKWITEITGLHP